MKTAMILGITGQDSSYLSELLLEKEYKVIGMKRRSSTNTLGRLDSVINNPNFSIVEGDIVDPSSINNLVAKYKPDELYNCAAMSHVFTSFQQPFYTFQVDAVGVANVLEAVRCFSPETKVLQCSTSELFGSNYTLGIDNKYQDENTDFAPNSPYAVAKLAAHELIRIYRSAYNIKCCAAISFNHESSRRGEEFVTRKITQWIGNWVKWRWRECYDVGSFVRNDIISTPCYRGTSGIGSTFPKLKLGNIDAVRDWSHAKDMVRGMWMILQQDVPKDYVLCSGVGHSVREFLDCAFSHIGIENWSSYVVIDPELYRPCEVEFLQGRYDRAKEELGWQPEISFEELVHEMVDYDIEHTK